MFIVSSTFILAVIAFLTVNSVVSILKLVICTGFPFAMRLLKKDSESQRADFNPIFAAAESFNTGIFDRIKWRRALNKKSYFPCAATRSQKSASRYNVFILVLIALIIGAEIMALVVLSPQQFELRAREANVPMHQVRTAVDRSLPIDPNGGPCDRINLRRTRETETTIWESKFCIKTLLLAYDGIRKEEERARSAGDKFRFLMHFDGSRRLPAITFRNEFSNPKRTTAFLGLLIEMRIRALATDEKQIFVKAAPRMRKDFTIFVIKRKFGTKCEFRDVSGINALTVRAACDLSVGGLLNISNQVVYSAKQLFTHVDSYMLHAFDTRPASSSGKGEVIDPIVKVQYGINLTSWRMILPVVLVLLATVSATVQTFVDEEISPEAFNDALRKEKEPNSATAMPFSTPVSKVLLSAHLEKLVSN